jgi:propionyl-CoA carboxylase alpha chain
VDGVLRAVQVLDRRPWGYLLQYCGAQRAVTVATPQAAALAQYMPELVAPDTSKIIASPMPGVCISVAVEVGQQLAAGAEVAVVEAMKMRNVLRSERAGTVAAVDVKPGDVLSADQVLVRLQ